MVFIRGSNPVWFMVDLTAHAFDDTFYMFVLQNTIPYLPATVYHDPDGTPWTNPIRFLANGTLPVDIFWDAGTIENPAVYRLEFRQGPTQADPLIYLVGDYAPGGFSSGDITSTALAIENQVTNPQFSLISFTSPVTVSATNPDPIPVAPGWDLVVTGIGIVTMTRVPLNSSAGTINPTNAPYALRLQLTGWDDGSIYLRQRFEQAGMLWANKTVASSVTARIQGASKDISATLVASDGTPLATVLDTVAVTSSFVEYQDFETLGDTTNMDIPPNAYIEYRLALPNNVDIYLTSFQLVPQDLETIIPYQQDTIERQVDHTFHYYKDGLLTKPIPSLLTGWDFAFNPAQFLGTTVAPQAVGANKSYYAWDQTILFQTANSGLSVAKDTIDASIVIAAPVAGQFAIIQYLAGNQATHLFLTMLEEGISANVQMAANPTFTGMTISLWWTANASLPDIKTNDSLVTGLDANGLPSVVAGWHQIVRSTPPEYSKFINTGLSFIQNFGFSGYDDEAPWAAFGTFFAIVIGSAPMDAEDGVLFRSISLVPGSVPTIPAPQTPDEVLRECQYYYRKSFLPGVVPVQGIGFGNGDSMSVQVAAANFNPAIGPIIRFDNPMITTPAVTLYTVKVGGSASQITNLTMDVNWSLTDILYITANGFMTFGQSNNASASTNSAGIHWTADSRLGTY